MLGRSAVCAATIGDVASKLNFKQYTLRTSIKMQQQKASSQQKKKHPTNQLLMFLFKIISIGCKFILCVNAYSPGWKGMQINASLQS